ncbi:MAG: cyclic nucleotide-binding domain-containing protein [Ignavibacteriaceae bacterium]|nr:cyclic nucleotide-binding domain-containing protein [Ignavibacteriaceae bacterium]
MDKDENEIIHSNFWSNFFGSSAKKADLKSHILSVPIFKDLNQSEISHLTKIIHNRNYIAGEFIFCEGDPGIGIYIIRNGEVIIRRNLENGSYYPLASFNRGDFFGELALIDEEKRSASALAKTDVNLSVIFKPELDEFIERFPQKGIKILRGITEIVATRLRKLNDENILLQNMLKIKSEKGYGT